MNIEHRVKEIVDTPETTNVPTNTKLTIIVPREVFDEMARMRDRAQAGREDMPYQKTNAFSGETPSRGVR